MRLRRPCCLGGLAARLEDSQVYEISFSCVTIISKTELTLVWTSQGWEDKVVRKLIEGTNAKIC